MFKRILIAASFLFVTTVTRADPVCLEETIRLATLTNTAPLENNKTVKNAIVEQALEKNLPVYHIPTTNGDVPVILVDAATADNYRTLMDNSYGVEIALQPQWRNDHGLMRIGNAIIDADTPGARGFGEINYTGLAWKDVWSYLPRRGENHSVVIEVAFVLSKDEKAIMDHYQKVRRAAIIRVPFTFGGNRPMPYTDNMLGAGEHCFVFCRAGAIGSHISEIEQKLRGMGVADVSEFMKSADVVAYLDAVKAKIAALDAFRDGGQLTPAMTLGADVKPLLTKILPAGIAGKDERIFANWVVGLDASRLYKKVMNDLGVDPYSNGMDIEMTRNRATAVLVYDKSTRRAAFGNANKTVAEAFKDGTYTSTGIFYTLPAKGKPLAK